MTKEAKTGIWWFAGVSVILVAVAFFAVRGCAFMPWNNSRAEMSLRITLTRDFGTEVLKDESIKINRGANAMQALQEVAEVETSYGGGFIHSVDGQASGYGGEGSREMDWFYYINGQMAEVGAEELEVRDGDWLLFDYHSWEYAMFTPAFAGCFPEPFVHGYGDSPRSCIVLCAPGWEEDGEDLADLLREAGAPSCTQGELSPEWRPREGEYALVVGTVEELEGNSFLAEANDNAARLGLSIVFAGDELVMLDEKGEVAGRLSSGAGLVEVIGPRLGEEGSAMMVTGTDPEGVKAALELLADWDNTDSGPVMVIVARAGEGGPETPVR